MLPKEAKPHEFTFHQLFIIEVFTRCRSVPRTLSELERIRGKPYRSPSYVRKVVQLYRTASDTGDALKEKAGNGA